MKSESIKKLLAVFLLSLAAIASMSTSQADLIDLSNSESAIEFTATNASWEIMPRFRYDEFLHRCVDEETVDSINISEGQTLHVILKLWVNEQGKMTKIRFLKDSGNSCIDKIIVKQVRTGFFKPFVKNGQAVAGHVILPLIFIAQ